MRRTRSRRPLQGSGERTDHEAELLQDHRVEQVPGRDTIPTQGAGVEARRSSGAFPVRAMRALSLTGCPRMSVHVYQSRVFTRPR